MVLFYKGFRVLFTHLLQSIVIFSEGNADPSLPMSTPCPPLNASMMPNQYRCMQPLTTQH